MLIEEPSVAIRPLIDTGSNPDKVTKGLRKARGYSRCFYVSITMEAYPSREITYGDFFFPRNECFAVYHFSFLSPREMREKSHFRQRDRKSLRLKELSIFLRTKNTPEKLPYPPRISIGPSSNVLQGHNHIGSTVVARYIAHT